MQLLTRRVMPWLLLLFLAGGCGAATYEQRLEETRRYYTYLDRLNQRLSRDTWHGPGVSMRVPKQFHLIPPPKPSKNSSNEPAESRQPTYAELVLPGIQGAWVAEVALSGEEGRAKAYLYVLSNYTLLGQKAADEKAAAAQAAEFNDSVVRTVAQAAGQPVPAFDKLPSREVPKNSKDAYSYARKYRTVSPGLALKADGKDYRVQIFGYRKGIAQVSVVLVEPQNTAAVEKLDQSLDMSLETLEVTAEKPSRGSGPSTPVPRSKGI